MHWQAAWKRYQGGQTTPIWIVSLADLKVEKIPRENSNDCEPDVGRRQDLLPLRPQRSRVALRLRPGDEEGRAGPAERRARLQVGLGRPRRHRRRAVRRSAPLRSGLGEGAAHFGLPRGRSARGPAALRQGRSAHRRGRDLAERGPGRVRGPRRDPDRPGREGRRPQPDEDDRRHGARPVLVARRQVDRLFLGRVRRIRPAHPRPGRPGAGEEDRARRAAVLLLPARLVARQQEDRLQRQAPDALVRRRRQGRAGQGRHDLLLQSDLHLRFRLVAGQPLAGLRQAAPEPHGRRLASTRSKPASPTRSPTA